MLYRLHKYKFSDAAAPCSSPSQSFNLIDLLNGVTRQHKWLFLANSHTVLDPDRHVPEVLRPPLIIRHIHPRFNSDTMSFTNDRLPAVANGIMHIHANVVAQMVWKQSLHSLRGHIEANLLQLILKQTLSDTMQLV